MSVSWGRSWGLGSVLERREWVLLWKGLEPTGVELRSWGRGGRAWCVGEEWLVLRQVLGDSRRVQGSLQELEDLTAHVCGLGDPRKALALGWQCG